MREFVDKAKILIEALPYIQKFRGKMVVVKFGGSAIEEDMTKCQAVLTDVALMECVGMCPVVVHGGGKAISRSLKKAGIETRFIKGLRVTCEKTIEIVERVLKDEINPVLVAALKRAGAKAVGLSGAEVFKVRKKTEVDRDTGAVQDWGFVGEPLGAETARVLEIVKSESVPVISPLGRGPDGRVYNVNADTAAATLARDLKARKLVFLSDVPGLLRDRSDNGSVIPTVRVDEVSRLVKEGIIDSGMLPKIRSGVDALCGGVAKVHIVDADMPHSLLLEIFTDKGVGTEITKDE